MEWTIKKKLFALTIVGLAFVVSVSVAGYWGISTVKDSSGDVAATGSAIRNHIEARMYNDLTRSDLSAIFKASGEEQKNKVDALAQDSRLLQERLVKARDLVTDSEAKKSLDEEVQLGGQYVSSAAALAAAIVKDPSSATNLLGPCLQEYKGLQGKIESSNDQLQKVATGAELTATRKAAGATHAMEIICGVSLILLLGFSTKISRGITLPLDSLSMRLKDMAEANDLTARADEERQDEIGELGRSLSLAASCRGSTRGRVHRGRDAGEDAHHRRVGTEYGQESGRVGQEFRSDWPDRWGH